jgi:hypothetical protein
MRLPVIANNDAALLPNKSFFMNFLFIFRQFDHSAVNYRKSFMIETCMIVDLWNDRIPAFESSCVSHSYNKPCNEKSYFQRILCHDVVVCTVIDKARTEIFKNSSHNLQIVKHFHPSNRTDMANFHSYAFFSRFSFSRIVIFFF